MKSETQRTKPFFDLTDVRRDPKTLRYCVICQRDLNPARPHYEVRLLNNEFILIHPDDWDESLVVEQTFYVGPECVKKIGVEWTRPAAVVAAAKELPHAR